MQKILFATKNESKMLKFKDKLLKLGIEMITINDLESELMIDEKENNAIDNALIKARAYANVLDIPVFAEDDSLYIDNIPSNLQPGVCVRRVLGKRLNDMEMIDYYSSLAERFGINGKLTCRFIYGFALVIRGKEYTFSYASEEFYLVSKPSIKVKEGYPLSSLLVDKHTNKYFLEMDSKINNSNDDNVIKFICDNLIEGGLNVR